MEIENWIQNVINGSGGFISMEDHEGLIHHIDRETSIASFVIRALANVNCEGSDDVLKLIKKQRILTNNKP